MSSTREDSSQTTKDPAPRRHVVLFVCTGNICRSPMAEVAFRSIATSTPLARGGTLDRLVDVQSAGTANWHVGSDMDPRARVALDAAGFRGEASTAAHVTSDQLDGAVSILALDRGHLADLRRLAPPDADLSLLLSWDASVTKLEVDDPFYGTDEDFARCLELIDGACRHLAVSLASRLDH